jgi:hypothetical protein
VTKRDDDDDVDANSSIIAIIDNMNNIITNNGMK